MVRWLFLNIGFLALALFSSGCGRIWGGVTWENQGPSSVFAYACSTQVFLIGNSNTGNTPLVTGSGFTYSVSPTLPPGLSLNSTTGIISGTPTTLTPLTAYTVTVNWPGGSTNTIVNIETNNGVVVNDLSDLDVNPPIGTVCNTTSGTCTLRAAIDATNNLGASQAILLPSGTIGLTLATKLNVTQAMEVWGNCQSGTTIDGLLGTQIMKINAGPTTLANVTIQNGSVFNKAGAGIQISAAVSSYTTTLSNVVIHNNTITGGASGLNYGAGIGVVGASALVVATLSLSNSTISGNVNDCNGGQFGGGVGFFSFTVGNISNCTFSNNQSEDGGGGVAVSNASVNISNSLFYNNSTIAGGGQQGGALFINNSGTTSATLTNVTFDSNSGNIAGAIYNSGGGSSTINVTNSTFANNNCVGGGLYGGAIGGIGAGNTVTNSIFYNNISGGPVKECGGVGGFNITTGGHNLSDDVVGDCNLNVGSGDIVSTNAQLGALQNNGGATSTMALSSGSPAINQASTGSCPATDQRGYARHLPTSCDIGAYEHAP